MTPNVTWKTLPLTPGIIQTALTTVGYKTNYARTVTSRFCPHYINSIRYRESSGVASYLISIDGCESSQVVASGRCDIYCCHPYTYEVQLSQKTAGSSAYGVVSLTKTLDQKSANDIRQEYSNLDIGAMVEAPEPVYGCVKVPYAQEEVPPEEPVPIPEPEIPVVQTPPPSESEETPFVVLPPLPEGAIVVPGRPDLVAQVGVEAPAAWGTGGELEIPTDDAQPVGEESRVPIGRGEPVDWTGGVGDNFLQGSEPFSTQLPDVESMSLRAEATISLGSQPGRFVGAASGFAPVVAVVGVAMAVVVVRLRGRNRTVSEEQAPLRSAHTTTVEPTVSADSKTSNAEPDLESV
ncbi:SAP domain-containing ribonucleoprotein [Phytophthora cinnamomi]|uniref:SAP domain-containing ribonucleoprotein n=1 Tax=Phytophthora cinnamomi TaxID=4785 RepID=UPI00355AA8A5|nr:SAP domain-containing ribonucleoprotein [Phytophthora cinnamomi]